MGLVPCPSCHRHARLDERVCPFCAVPYDEATVAKRVAALRSGVPAGLGLKRALVYAVGTGTLVLTSCEQQPNAPADPAVPSASAPELPPTEPDEEYELEWRTLTEEELGRLVHPAPPPPTAVVRRRKVLPCPSDPASDPLYGGCL